MIDQPHHPRPSASSSEVRKAALGIYEHLRNALPRDNRGFYLAFEDGGVVHEEELFLLKCLQKRGHASVATVKAIRWLIAEGGLRRETIDVDYLCGPDGEPYLSTEPVAQEVLAPDWRRLEELMARIGADARGSEENGHREKSDSGGLKTKKRRRRAETPKRTWRQPELDNAILGFKADMGDKYVDLKERIENGDPEAVKEAREVFGRNAIARSLGVRSPAMVSKSRIWQTIREELALHSDPRLQKNRVGFEIAQEESALATSKSPQDIAMERETIEQIKESMPEDCAEPTIEKLQRGDITVDEAEGILNAWRQQRKDDRTDRIHQRL